MKATVPKQFLALGSAPVLDRSLHLFLEKLPAYCSERGLAPPAGVVLVMDPKYRPEYQSIVDAYDGKLAFADPGEERRDSVLNGLRKAMETTKCEYVAVHDSARPLVTVREIVDVVTDAHRVGAAALGVPCEATIVESANGRTVLRTVPRQTLWEVQTPQVAKVEALLRGFEKVQQEGMGVTDVVSVIEALGETVWLTKGEYTNLKITTLKDVEAASAILMDRGEGEIVLKRRATKPVGVPMATVKGVERVVNPFSKGAAQRAGERDYNSFREIRYADKDPYRGGEPTPSRWHE
jgi:2-C-methyl-D-erythritol 4-phosphate cytidylyltransferase